MDLSGGVPSGLKGLDDVIDGAGGHQEADRQPPGRGRRRRMPLL